MAPIGSLHKLSPRTVPKPRQHFEQRIAHWFEASKRHLYSDVNDGARPGCQLGDEVNSLQWYDRARMKLYFSNQTLKLGKLIKDVRRVHPIVRAEISSHWRPRSAENGVQELFFRRFALGSSKIARPYVCFLSSSKAHNLLPGVNPSWIESPRPRVWGQCNDPRAFNRSTVTPCRV
jgi:hypothetical protein